MGIVGAGRAKKKKTVFVCRECGHESAKWTGKCYACGAWNTMTEEVVVPEAANVASELSGSLSPNVAPVPITEAQTEKLPRFSTGSAEFDRVLGGGVVVDSLVLIVGDPGIGKSSLTLKTCANVAATGKRVLYVTGEESVGQIRLRAERLNALPTDLFVVSETNLAKIALHIDKLKPALVVIDSVQTVFRPEIDSAAGSVAQVRECAVEIMRIVKSAGLAGFVIGHVTKDGTLAGPRLLEHIVDTVLYFEGERTSDHRILRAVKNRFGSTNEMGVFEMRDTGLSDVPDASRLFLENEAAGTPGTVVIPVIEGTRALLVELQALVAPTPYIPPHRTSDSVDIKRIQLLLAVLEKRVHLSIGACDVFVKAAGGMNLDEPAADLGICAAMASSFANRQIREKTIIFGEVGLSGEVRAVSRAELRLSEAKRLGFTDAVLPQKNYLALKDEISGINIFGAKTVGEALRLIMPKR